MQPRQVLNDEEAQEDQAWELATFLHGRSDANP